MKLKFRTSFENLQTAYIIGEFCEWDLERVIEIKKTKSAKFFVVDDMPIGEYKILNCKSFIGAEKYPNSKEVMGNRYFSGIIDEQIFVNYIT